VRSRDPALTAGASPLLVRRRSRAVPRLGANVVDSGRQRHSAAARPELPELGSGGHALHGRWQIRSGQGATNKCECPSADAPRCLLLPVSAALARLRLPARTWCYVGCRMDGWEGGGGGEGIFFLRLPALVLVSLLLWHGASAAVCMPVSVQHVTSGRRCPCHPWAGVSVPISMRCFVQGWPLTGFAEASAIAIAYLCFVILGSLIMQVLTASVAISQLNSA
jgi:hypothetical protein